MGIRARISMEHYFFVALISLALSLILTPVMIIISRKLKILDYPNNRKMHTTPIPLMGGAAIYLSTIAATVIYIVFFVKGIKTNIVSAFIIGISGVTLMGIIDDILSLSPKRRLATLFILALIVLVGCLQFYFPPRLMESDALTVVLISVIVVFWIVAITNAINFLDGLDGLASCLSLISVAAFIAIFYLQGRTQLALPTAVALFGAILGFLVFNISPAKIFMGDAGSMFIGFMLGILTIMSLSQKNIIEVVVPVYIMIVPIADLTISVLRRILLRKSIMQPDRHHLHHDLTKRLKNKRMVVLALGAFQLIMAFVGIIIYVTESFVVGWIGIGVFGILCVGYTLISLRTIRQESPISEEQ